MFVSIQSLRATLIPQVPDPQGFVITSGDQKLAAGMKHDSSNPVVVRHKNEQSDSSAYVPYSTTSIFLTLNYGLTKKINYNLIVLSLEPDARKGPMWAPFLLSAPAASLIALAAVSGAHAIHSTTWS